uniref:DNA2/NAM7 helicase helicase domain-containing protein n=1 Tax=Ditylenchus dipsaci TaxID=166011 RepID=A0A915EF19_9BILA
MYLASTAEMMATNSLCANLFVSSVASKSVNSALPWEADGSKTTLRLIMPFHEPPCQEITEGSEWTWVAISSIYWTILTAFIAISTYWKPLTKNCMGCSQEYILFDVTPSENIEFAIDSVGSAFVTTCIRFRAHGGDEYQICVTFLRSTEIGIKKLGGDELYEQYVTFPEAFTVHEPNPLRWNLPAEQCYRLLRGAKKCELSTRVHGGSELNFDFYQISVQFLRKCGVKIDNEQEKAIKNCAEDGLHCVQGPPGTGKTSVIVAYAVIHSLTKFRTLICAPSIEGANSIALRIQEMVQKNEIRKELLSKGVEVDTILVRHYASDVNCHYELNIH